MSQRHVVWCWCRAAGGALLLAAAEGLRVVHDRTRRLAARRPPHPLWRLAPDMAC